MEDILPEGGTLVLIMCVAPGCALHQRALSSLTPSVLPGQRSLVVCVRARARRSNDVEHIVRSTRATRQCVVGWFNEYSEQREPDLDAMSLRTRAPVAAAVK